MRRKGAYVGIHIRAYAPLPLTDRYVIENEIFADIETIGFDINRLEFDDIETNNSNTKSKIARGTKCGAPKHNSIGKRLSRF